jgi:hypothetical protein
LKIMSTISNVNSFSSLHLYTCGKNSYYSLCPRLLCVHFQLFYSTVCFEKYILFFLECT